jgi:hypothetical protein
MATCSWKGGCGSPRGYDIRFKIEVVVARNSRYAGKPIMEQSRKEFAEYLALLVTMTGIMLSTVMPAFNMLLRVIPVPSGKEVLFGQIGTISTMFFVGWIYAARRPLWAWHIGLFGLGRRIRKLRSEIEDTIERHEEHKMDPFLAEEKIHRSETRIVVLTRVLKELPEGIPDAGTFRIQLLSLALFTTGILCLAMYLLIFLA